MKKMINTDKAPAAIGSYSQAMQVANTVYISGQIPLNPETMSMVTGPMELQVSQVFENIKAIAEAAGGDLADIVKLNVYLLDLKHFDVVNQVMKNYFKAPFPARALLGVAAMPKQAEVEIEAIMVLSGV
ncbi:MAG: putative endoribonuclease [Gammaproteobacteria bacterium]|jgi:reactive intermediate/imine deaminase|nr:putative endoribonuclease [Gammaproteobacteria bacterium]